MSPERLRYIIAVSVNKPDLPPALRASLAQQAFVQCQRRLPLFGAFAHLSDDNTTTPHLVVVSRQ